jgi:hypothetical protein
MKVFGHGAGVVFPVPAAIAQDVCRFCGVRAPATYIDKNTPF